MEFSEHLLPLFRPYFGATSPYLSHHTVITWLSHMGISAPHATLVLEATVPLTTLGTMCCQGCR